jgi:uncharacterized delta-60 repeat protein
MKVRRALIRAVVVAVVVAVGSAVLAQGALAGGGLDTTFGSGGTAVAVDASESGWSVTGTGGTAQPDGKPIVVGYERFGDNSRMLVARFTTAGQPDASFGNGTGQVTLDPFGYPHAVAQTAIVESNGQILVGGYAKDSGGNFMGILARFNADGTLDTSFAGGWGFVNDNYPLSHSKEVTGISEAPNGDIVFVTDTFDFSGYDVMRVASTGSTVSSFGDLGHVTYLAGGSGAYGVIVQPDGQIDLSWSSGGATGLYQLNADGSGNFDWYEGIAANTWGHAPADGTADAAYGFIRQPDGKLVAAGGAGIGPHGSTSDETFMLERWNADGTLDTSFGQGGIVTTQLGSHDDEIESVIQAPDGKLIAIGLKGLSETDSKWVFTIAVARYTSDGLLDKTFGKNGTVVLSSGFANGGAMMGDGRFYAFGANLGGASVERFVEGAASVTFSPAQAAAGDVVHIRRRT